MRLKGLFLGLALLALAAGQASAQTFNLGLEAGANFSNFIGSDVTTDNVTGSRLGFVGGGFLSLNFGNSFAIRPEILYEQKGGKDTSNNTYQLDYVEIPVLLKFSLGTPGINPAILLGPSFSFNMVAQVANSGNTSTITNSNGSDIGVIGGVEVDIDKFLVSGRYELGFNDVATSTHLQNGTLTFLVGYAFM